MDVTIKNYVQKLNFFAGSKEDVEYITTELNEEPSNVSGKKGSYASLLEIQGKFENTKV